MIDELKVTNIIDNHINQDLSQRKVSIGECVKAMILNGLGFVNSQLYLVSDFLAIKPVEKLFGREVQASFFNDDVLGRALDSLYINDICQLFTKISTNTCKVLKLTNQTYHLDSTSIHTHGNHENKNPHDENVVKLVKGYSRDHHPELNQVILEMIVSNTSGIPLAMKPLSGNCNDTKEFPKIIKSFVKNLQYSDIEPITLIADSALYSAENISTFPTDVKFITRVPERIKELKNHYNSLNVNEFEIIDNNYSFKEVTSNYGGVEQRWIILLSKPALAKKLKTYEKNLEKKINSEKKRFAAISKKDFACQEDALKETERFNVKCKYLKYENIEIEEFKKHTGKGRPKKDSKGVSCFRIKAATFKKNNDLIEEEKSKLGLFTLTTNHLEKYTGEEILKLYKDQGKVERGFRFIKDNTFMASSLYLEKPQRIEALMFVMSLCLMVYSALEYRIRKGLKEKKLTFTSQTKKEVQNPTTKWVFYNFIGINILYIEKQLKVLNKEAKHKIVLRLLGEKYQTYYS